jgi:RNA polymerase sigma-70 factor (ECF subfamily)
MMNDRGASESAEAVVDGGTVPAGGADLTSVFNELRDELVSTLWFIVGNRDDALDAAQETFVKCWKARDSLHEVINLRAWIFRVGMNAARDLKRSAWRRKAKPLSGAGDDAMYVDAAHPPANRVLHEEELDRLRDALVHLRDDEKEVFLLRQNGGLTYEQIAELRDSPIGTVKTQMRTALIKLKKVLAGGDC